MNDPTPVPEPGGALDPPRRRPPTTLSTDTPPPPTPPASSRGPLRGRRFGVLRAFRLLALTALDLADLIADTVTGRTGRRA